MSDVENNLLSGETILHRAKIHGSLFLTGFILLLLGLSLSLTSGLGRGIGIIILVLSLIRLLNDTIVSLTSEFAITSKRIIVKFGLIRRITSGLNHKNVESLNADQSISGRILDYGTITVNGTGGSKTPVPFISSPLKFRKEAMQLIDSSHGDSGHP